MNERVKPIRKALGMIQADFGERLGITGSAVAYIEKGKRALTDQMKKAIIREFDVNPLYLEQGIEPMFRTQDDSLAALSARIIKNDDPNAKAFLKTIATLPAGQLASLVDTMRRTLADIDNHLKENS